MYFIFFCYLSKYNGLNECNVSPSKLYKIVLKMINIIISFYAPNFFKLEEHIVFRLTCLCVRHAFWCMPYLMNSACKGFGISYMDSSWKNSWPIFFSCPSYVPSSSYASLNKTELNLVSKISQKLFELGAWNLVSWQGMISRLPN